MSDYREFINDDYCVYCCPMSGKHFNNIQENFIDDDEYPDNDEYTDEEQYDMFFYAAKPTVHSAPSPTSMSGTAGYSIGNGKKPWTLVEHPAAQGAAYSLSYSNGKPITLVKMQDGAAGYKTHDGKVRSLPKTVVQYLRGRGITGISTALAQNVSGMAPGSESGSLILTDGQSYPGFSY